ncbi:MAG: hypothetical protein GC184_01250 [Rhizobiales bacterium]|nr:hypothetical protein [Hyphomicrobiales bacterium]
MTSAPSDSDGTSDSRKTESDAEVISPDTTGRAHQSRSKKEPPVIDAKAEATSSKSGVAMGVIGGGVAGVIGAAGLLALAYGMGYGHRVETAPLASQIDAVSTNVAALEKSSGEARSELEQKLEAQLEANDARIAAQEKALAELPPIPENVTSNQAAVEALNARLDKLASQSEALQASLNETRSASLTLTGRVDELAKAMPPADIAQRVDQLSAMITALNTAVDALAPRVEELHGRVAAIEAKAAEPDPAARAALGLALANLARASQGPGGFDAELEAVATLLPGMPEIDELRAASKAGVPTMARLKQDFPQLLDNVFQAEAKSDESSLWTKFLGNAMSIITVRRTGEVSGDSTEAIMARMEERLKVDDLAGAVAEAKGLDATAKDAAATWLGQAKARLRTDRLVRELSARVAAGLATKEPSAPSADKG